MTTKDADKLPLEILDELTAVFAQGTGEYRIEVVADFSRGGAADPDGPLAIIKDSEDRVVATARVRGRTVWWKMLVQSMALAATLQSAGCVVTAGGGSASSFVGTVEVARVDRSDRDNSGSTERQKKDEDTINVVMEPPRLVLNRSQRASMGAAAEELVASLGTEDEQNTIVEFTKKAVRETQFLVAKNDMAKIDMLIGPSVDGQKTVRISQARNYFLAEERMSDGDFQTAEQVLDDALKNVKRVSDDRWEYSQIASEIGWARFVSRVAQSQSHNDIVFSDEEVEAALNDAELIFGEDTLPVARALVHFWAQPSVEIPPYSEKAIPELEAIRLMQAIHRGVREDELKGHAIDFLSSLSQSPAVR